METIGLAWDLADLPSAQHRAGLAGLVLQVETMRRRGLGPLPEMEVVDGRLVEATFSAASLTAVLNDVYAATYEEGRQRAQRKDKKTGEPIAPLRVDEVEEEAMAGTKAKRTRYYIYLNVVPRAPTLEALEMPAIWLKLWRDAVWQTLRGIPKTRLPYEQRANGEDVAVARATWADLGRGGKSQGFTTEVASSLYVGAQAASAELVPFRGRPAENLLLHFWPLVTSVGEVWRYGASKEGPRPEAAGYVLSVPDVADVGEFVGLFRGSVAELNPQRFGYRPRDAVLALPAEGGMQFLRRIAQLAQAKEARRDVRYAVSSVEVYHLCKRGNSIALLGAGRVPVRPELIDGYEALAQGSRSLLFRGQAVRNLLDGRPWYSGFGAVMEAVDRRLVLGRTEFGGDVRRRFAAESGGL